MYPHPVYVPSGEIRDLRALFSQRRVLHADYQSWRYRARAYLRKFEMCRLCFRDLALRGDIPGVIKSSW